MRGGFQTSNFIGPPRRAQYSRFLAKPGAEFYSMELCILDLLHLMNQHPEVSFDLNLQRNLQKSICDGLNALHKKAKHAHLDIKLENILIGYDFEPKIADFGFAQPVDRFYNRCVGTQTYLAPEIDACATNSRMSYNVVTADIFSLGVLFFILMFRVYPWDKASILNHSYRKQAFRTTVFWREVQVAYEART